MNEKKEKKEKGKILGFGSLGGNVEDLLHPSNTKRQKENMENMHQINSYLKSLYITRFY